MPEYGMFLADRDGVRTLDVLELIGPPPPVNGALTHERARDIMNILIGLGYTANDLPTDGEVTAAWRAASKVIVDHHRQRMMEVMRAVDDEKREMQERNRGWFNRGMAKNPWWRK